MKGIDKLLWSVAFPGFGQLLNGKYFKGVLFIGLEFLINIQSKLNQIILSSFNGDVVIAIRQTNYEWLMFYPCVYMFAIWDAYYDAGGGKSPFSVLPFVFSAYFATVGVMYSATMKILGILLGPVWLPMLLSSIGICFGFIVKFILIRTKGYPD